MLVALLAAPLFVIASGSLCADENPTGSNPGDLEQHASASELEVPVSSSSTLWIRDTNTVSESLWSVLHHRNPKGTFSIVRNAINPDESPANLHVFLGEQEGRLVQPRQTATWSCDVIGETSSLKVTAESGEAIYSASIRCGDAVYLRTSSTGTLTTPPLQEMPTSVPGEIESEQ